MEWKNCLNIKAGRAGRRVLVLLPFWLFVVADLSAGVLVAPTVVYMSDRERTGRITVQNPSDEPKEVSVYVSFGIPESDSLGGVRITLADSAITDPRSAADWIKVFPRRLILGPGETQVVRFVARPPKDIPDGEYWARIVIRAEHGQTTIPSANQVDGIVTTLNMVMQTAIALKFRTGNLVSKLEVYDTKIKPSDSLVQVLVSMENLGNVSYVGLLTSILYDANDRQICQDNIDLAVYRKLTRNLNLPIPEGDFQKPYRVEIAIGNEGRKDVRAEYAIPGNRIEYGLAVE